MKHQKIYEGVKQRLQHRLINRENNKKLAKPTKGTKASKPLRTRRLPSMLEDLEAMVRAYELANKNKP